jgi:serine/threonine-protein kinase
MSQDDWARLKDLFHDAVERTGPDRAAFVEEACRTHPHLEARLRALLASHSEAGDFLETPVYGDVAADAQQDDDVTEPLRPGDVVDDTYEVQSTLGAGGMGVVYRVIHRGLKRPFAAKVIHARVAADGGFLERFEREAVALGRLKHPNIVDVTDYGVERGGNERPYLIMECLDGTTLAERLRSGPVAAETALTMFEAIAAALDHAHSRGVLHLDLKPANISLNEAGATTRVKILDFGLAQFTATEDGDGTQNAPLAGTPAYLAPELLDGGVPGAAADIYAFGVLMYETLTGRPPFEGSTSEVLDRQRHTSPPPPSTINPGLPAGLDDALIGILAKDPAARPRTAEAALSGVRAAVVAHQQRVWRRREIPRRALIATALALALGVISPLLSTWSAARRLELLTVDARFAAAPSRPPSGNVVLLMLDDASLDADPTPVVQRADTFGRDLQRVLAAGARSVAVDFLLPAWWGDSDPFTLLVLEDAERLTLAAFSDDTGKVVGPECIAGVTTVALGPERAAAIFGFINLDQDEDGVSRMARLFFRDLEGTLRPSFAARAAMPSGSAQVRVPGDHQGDRFWIDHRIDMSRFTRVSWKDLDATLRERPEVFRDRVVLTGVDYGGSGDEPRVPTRERIPGVVLHAAIVETILAGFPVRGVGRSALILISIVGSALLCSIALISRPSVAVSALAAAGLSYAVAMFVLFARGGLMAPFIVPLVLAVVAAAAGYAIRRKLRPYPGA